MKIKIQQHVEWESSFPVSGFSRVCQMPLYLATQAAITKYHILGGSNNRNYFLTVLKGRSPRSRCHQVCFWWGFSSWFADAAFFLCPQMAFTLYTPGERLLWSFSLSLVSIDFHLKILILLDSGSTFMTSFHLNYLPKTLSPNTITLGILASIYGWGGLGRGRTHNSGHLLWEKKITSKIIFSLSNMPDDCHFYRYILDINWI